MCEVYFKENRKYQKQILILWSCYTLEISMKSKSINFEKCITSNFQSKFCGNNL